MGGVGEWMCDVFFFQAEDGIRDDLVTGVQTCALPISFLVAAAPTLFILPISRCGSAPAFYTANFSLRQRPTFYTARFSLRQRPDRKSVVEGKSVDLGGRRIIKKKIKKINSHEDEQLDI